MMPPMVIQQKRATLFLCDVAGSTVRSTEAYLTAKNFAVRCISDSHQAIEQIVTHVPDLVLINASLPVAGGYEVCAAVRPYYAGPILILGREADEAFQLLAFERGADDYVMLPASPVLLAARIKAHLKRGIGMVQKPSDRHLKVGDLFINATRREVFLGGQPVDLTTIQFDLLWYMAKRSGRVVPREELYTALFQEDYNGFDRSVDVYISRIRNRLGDKAESPSFLKTVRGVGYLFVSPQ